MMVMVVNRLAAMIGTVILDAALSGSSLPPVAAGIVITVVRVPGSVVSQAPGASAAVKVPVVDSVRAVVR